MESFFFVPANRLNKLDLVDKLNLDNVIIDFEDSIISEQRETSFKKLLSFNNFQSFWLRIPLRGSFESHLETDFLKKVYSSGIRKIVLPKVLNSKELLSILEMFQDVTFLILVEHPRLLIELKDFLSKNESFKKNIYAVGLGSHDLMAFMNTKHELTQLEYPRKKLQYIAKAYDLKAIDIASMNISDQDAFRNEIHYAINNGFDGKFLIHPIQYEWMKSTLIEKKEDMDWAKKIIAQLPNDYNPDGSNIDINPFVLDGEVIEKPHIIKAFKIFKKK